MSKPLQVKHLHTDVLIIGGGTAGCYAALTISRNSGLNILVAEKANIKRSGCLAAGVNAINAYIVKGRRPQDYVDYATKDAAGIVRNDLLLTAAEEFNEVTADMEKLGLVILKDENGDYVFRYKWDGKEVTKKKYEKKLKKLFGNRKPEALGNEAVSYHEIINQISHY